MYYTEQDREGQREREREREQETERDTERQTETDTETDRHSENSLCVWHLEKEHQILKQLHYYMRHLYIRWFKMEQKWSKLIGKHFIGHEK